MSKHKPNPVPHPRVFAPHRFFPCCGRPVMQPPFPMRLSVLVVLVGLDTPKLHFV